MFENREALMLLAIFCIGGKDDYFSSNLKQNKCTLNKKARDQNRRSDNIEGKLLFSRKILSVAL